MNRSKFQKSTMQWPADNSSTDQRLPYKNYLSVMPGFQNPNSYARPVISIYSPSSGTLESARKQCELVEDFKAPFYFPRTRKACNSKLNVSERKGRNPENYF